MPGYRDPYGIMYFANGGMPAGELRPDYGGYGGGYGGPRPQLPGGGLPPGGNGVPAPPRDRTTNPTEEDFWSMMNGGGQRPGSQPQAPYGQNTPGGAGGVPGLTSSQFGQNPYITPVPLSNTFIAQTPSSNLDFGQGQYQPAMQQSAGNLGALQGMLMSQAQGGGPNPAAEQFRQSTDRNIAQAYALGQSQPGNAGAARNIAENVGQINQQGASDAAQQRMQQQLNAQGMLGQLGLGVYGTSGRLMTDAQKLQLEQAQGNQQAALNAQNINAQTSLNNQQYGANVVGAGINAAADVAAKGADYLFKNKGNTGGGNSDAGWTTGDQTPAPDMSGDYGDYGGGGGDTQYAALGGLIKPRHYDEGGAVAPYGAYVPPNSSPADYSDYSGKSQVADPRIGSLLSTGPSIGQYQAVKKGQYGGRTDVSKAADKVAESVPYVGALYGGLSALGNLFADGGGVPGQGLKPGNSYSNDTVPAMLSPGEIVLPRSVTQSADAAEKAKAFVQAIKSRKKKSA